MVETNLNVVGNMDKKLSEIRGQLLSTNKQFEEQSRQVDILNRKLSAYTKQARQVNPRLKQSGGYAKNAAAGFAMLDKSMGHSTKQTKKHGKAVNGLLLQYFGISAAIGIARRVLSELIDYTKASIKSFRSFEKRMREVSTILSDVGENFSYLSAGVQGMALRFGKSADDLAKGLYNILSAAVPVSESLQFLFVASKAAVAGLTSVEKAVDVLTTVYNAYGKTVAQMQSVTDTMFQAVVRGKFRFEDLASSLGYVVPIASQVGISFEELAAAMATATRNGQKIDMVSRGLAMAIQNIIKPSEKAKQVAAEHGVELNEAALQVRGLTGYLKYLNEASEGNASIISQIIPNMRSYRVMMVLAGDSVQDVESDTELMNTALGQAEVAFGKVASSTQTAKDIIDEYSESVKRMTGSVTSNLDLLGSKLDSFKGFTIANLLDPNQPLSLVGGLSTSIIRGALQTKEVMSMMDKELADNIAKWEESQGEFERQPDMLSQVMEGGQIDTAPIKAAKDEYERLLTAAEKYGELYDRELGKTGWGRKNDGDLAIMGMKFGTLATKVEEAKAAFDVYKSSIDDAEESVENYYNAIGTALTRMKELREEVGEVGKLYDGQLGKQLEIAEQNKVVGDMSHYIALAKEEEVYQLELAEQNYEWYTEDVGNAIDVIRNYNTETKKAAQAQNEFNEALARNRIETMKIQLLGMMRRRGNTRAEMRTLKKLSIERTEYQIEAAEDALDAEIEASEEGTDGKKAAYEAAVELIEKMQRAEEHNLWLLKDTRNQDIQDLRETIETKERIYLEYQQQVEGNQKSMGTSLEAYKTLASTIYGEDIPSYIQITIEAMEEAIRKQNQLAQKEKITTRRGIAAKKASDVSNTIKKGFASKGVNINNNWSGKFVTRALDKFSTRLTSYKRGTSYIPSDGAYMLHRGEEVVNRQNTSNESVVVNVNVSGNTIASENVDNIANQIADQVQKGLVDKRTGKSKYRMR